MEPAKPSLFINLLALAGSAIVIAVLIWGIVNFTGWTTSKMAALFDNDDTEEQIETGELSEDESAPTTPNNENTTPTPAITPQYPDLSVRVLYAGMNGAEAYVVFDIANRGTAPTGSWYFTAAIPTTGTAQYYVSPAQISLAPGAHIENTLRFSPLSGNYFNVTADPASRVAESNESNNTASHYLSYSPTPIPYYGY